MNKSLFILTFILICCSSTLSAQYEEEVTQFRNQHLEELMSYEDPPLNEKTVKGVRYFEIDEELVFDAVFEAEAMPDPVKIPTYAGKIKEYIVVGRIHFEYEGVKYTLKAYQNIKFLSHPVYKKYYFVPFKDFTNGESTYGGGRYIDIHVDAIKGNNLTLDFNKAYNPWCAYSDGYNCTIPPVENHLKVAIEAGEAAFVKQNK